MSDYETWLARCSAGHPDARWTATPAGGSDYRCADCDADVPPQPVIVPPSAWTFAQQRRRLLHKAWGWVA